MYNLIGGEDSNIRKDISDEEGENDKENIERSAIPESHQSDDDDTTVPSSDEKQVLAAISSPHTPLVKSPAKSTGRSQGRRRGEITESRDEK